MSKKYLEQVSSTGISRKKVESKFGMKILAKCGWTEGEGLGKNKDGIVDCIQIRKKEDNLGLGASIKKSNWNDQWWQNSYDNILKNMNLDIKNEIKIEYEEEEDEEEIVIKKQSKQAKRKNSDSDDESSTSTMSENSEKEKKKSSKNKKVKKIESDDEEQEESQFIHKKRKRMIKFIKL